MSPDIMILTKLSKLLYTFRNVHESNNFQFLLFKRGGTFSSKKLLFAPKISQNYGVFPTEIPSSVPGCSSSLKFFDPEIS